MEKMTDEEIRQFLLEEARTAKVATVREDGSPHVVPVWFDLDGDRLVFTTWHESAKAAHMERDPRVAVSVDDETPPFAFVMIQGTVEIDKEADDLRAWATRIAGRYMGQELAGAFGKRNGVPGEWLIRVTPTHIVAQKNLAGGTEMETTGVQIRPVTPDDEEWVAQFIRARWGANRVVAHGNLFFPDTLPGFIAEKESGERVGLITYHVQDQQCEVITVDSVETGRGIGIRLMNAVEEAARDAGCRRLWVITTNDNLRALRFYQKRGFTLKELRPNALEFSRRLKPEIPLVGEDGIPLRDEIELEKPLT